MSQGLSFSATFRGKSGLYGAAAMEMYRNDAWCPNVPLWRIFPSCQHVGFIGRCVKSQDLTLFSAFPLFSVLCSTQNRQLENWIKKRCIT